MISLRAYARHRGCTLSSVQRAIRDGRLSGTIVHDARGRPQISDVAAADAEWNATTRAEYVPHAVQARKGEQAPGAPAADAPPSAGALLTVHRARREAANAAIAEMELARLRGELVDAEEVKARWAGIVVMTRNKVLGLPSKIKADLPDLTQAAMAVIERRIREALEELADRTTTAADQSETDR